MKKNKYILCGVYKITSPSNKVYIGYSEDIERRFREYKTYQCKNQIHLYNSLVKYGSENHIFEILELCDFDQVLKRERYYQDFYNVLGGNGLNCILTETDELPRVYKKGHYVGENNPYYGKKHTEEILQKMRDAHKKRKLEKPESYKKSPEQKLKLIGRQKGKIISQEQRDKISKAHKGKKLPKEIVLSMQQNSRFNKSIDQFDLEGNFIKTYISVAEAARQIGISNSAIQSVLRGVTHKAGGFKWKYSEGVIKESYFRQIPKQVHLYDRITGNFIQEFRSINEIAEFLKVKPVSARNFLTKHRVHKKYILNYRKVNNILENDIEAE